VARQGASVDVRSGLVRGRERGAKCHVGRVGQPADVTQSGPCFRPIGEICLLSRSLEFACRIFR
jgi:hypothetical protein